MFLLTIKKMLKNKWITACLFLGCFLIMTVAASIPAYTNGVLEKLLLRDLHDVQNTENIYPGFFSYNQTFAHSEKNTELSYNQYQEALSVCEKIFQQEPLQELEKIYSIETNTLGPFAVFPPDYAFEDDITVIFKDSLSSQLNISAVSEIEEHLNIIYGRMYEDGQQADGTYEIIISNAASQFYNMTINNIYHGLLAVRPYGTQTRYKFKVVGIYEMKDPSDAFWYNGFSDYERCTLVSTNTFKDLLDSNKSLISKYSSCVVFDYEKLHSEQVTDLVDTFNRANNSLSSKSLTIPAYSALKQYSDRQEQLTVLILLLDIPLLVILIFYIYMVSRLIVGYDENEISVLKSRGAKRSQIMQMYLYECILIAVVAFIPAIICGMGICSLIGYSDGFLQFVNRTKMNISLSPTIIFYTLISCVIFIIATLIPIFFASRKNILNHKQGRSNQEETPLWQKICLDILLIGASLYGLFLYNESQRMALLIKDEAYQSNNPLIFLMSSLFVLGCCLFLIRIYPGLIRFIHWVGKRFWPASIHVSMVNLSRNKSMGKTIVLFLSFTISIGIFSAATARTVNQNEEDKINYKNGADIVLQQRWIPTYYVTHNQQKIPMYTSPPPLDILNEVDGIESFAKVYLNAQSNHVTAKGKVSGSTVMAIQPAEFSKVVWSRDSLLPYHINTYLNSLSKTPNGCLISSETAKMQDLKIGDSVYITIESLDPQIQPDSIAVTICGIIDYFPTYNPRTQIDARGGDTVLPTLVVVNYDYLFRFTQMDKYDVWIKRDDSISTENFYQSLEDNNVEIVSIINTAEEILKEIKNDSIIQGMNGTLSLSFIIAMVITSAGFLIYWIVDIKSRLLQFSVLRSMGVSKGSLYSMIAFEQLLTASFSIIGGIIVGGLSSMLYIQSVGMYMDLTTQVPPFQVLIFVSDYIKIFGVILLLVLICLISIFSIIRRLNIASTLKLGED